MVREAVTCGERVERVTGIEPAWPAWKAGALPLSYTRVAPGGSGRRGNSVARGARLGALHHCSGGGRAVAQLGSASALGAEGRRFKSCQPDLGF